MALLTRRDSHLGGAENARRPARVSWRVVAPMVAIAAVGLTACSNGRLGGPKPEYDHVTVVEMPRTKTRRFNAAVVTGLVPTKGLTLHIVSYGGSSLVVRFIGVGMLISISRDRHGGASKGGRGESDH